MDKMIEKIRRQIAQNKLEDAINSIYTINLPKDELNSIVLMESRFNEINKKSQLGLISNEEAALELNKIRNSLLNILTDIDSLLNESLPNPSNSNSPNYKGRKIKVLIIFSNPRGTVQLDLSREDKIIKESIKLSKNRDNIEVHTLHAASVHDLRRSLLENDFDIVHLSGHGTGIGLILEDELGGKYVVPQKGLAELFKAYSHPTGSLSCVILNACYSISQGELISLETPYTIAMEGAVSDIAAIEFSRGFYDAIGAYKNIDFAYEEGCRNVMLSAPKSKFVSKILNKGERYLGSVNDFTQEEISEPSRSLEDNFKNDKSLIGIAVDVSGSMTGSINNNTNRQLSRLESFNESLKRLGEEANKTIKANKDKKVDTNIDVFAYAFGLRTGDICDLFSLLKIGKSVISKEEIEDLKRKYTNEMKRNYSGYSGLGDLARRHGFGGLVNQAESMLRGNAENEIRKKIMQEVSRRIQKSLNDVGDTTLSIDEVTKLSNDSSDTFSNAEELIYGITPMRSALKEIHQRFERELNRRPSDTIPVLFIVSDGEPTDGEPRPFAKLIKELGVTIVTCFVTSMDVVNPKTLIGDSEEITDAGAELMFDMASPIDESSDYARFLLKKGWTINKNGKLFVQINHSSILEEFINVVLSPIEESYSQSLPMGI